MEKFPPHENENAQVPFGDKLTVSKISEVHIGRDKLFEFAHNPDKIIRVESFSTLEKRYKDQIDPIDVAILGRKLYKELENAYGIFAPVDYVAGKDSKGDKVVYGITDKVDGENLDEIEVTPEITEKVELLYSSISQYYLDKSPKDEPYLADINNASQYMYGKRKDDEFSRIYLVDTDLYIRDGKVALCNVVLWLYRHMASVERKYGKKFTHAREIIGQILNTPLPQNITEEQRTAAQKINEKTKGYLEGRIPIDNKDAHPIFSNLK